MTLHHYYQAMSLHELLELPHHKQSLLQKGFEVVGDIAIVTIPPELEAEKYLIAAALADHRNVKTVLNKRKKLEGDHRLGGYEVLLGGDTVTCHCENGCCFMLDLHTVFFNSKLGFERNRIAAQVKDGESILGLFCGVGPFLIPIAKTKDVRIIGLEKNGSACHYFKKNIFLNHIEEDRIHVITGDANNMDCLFKGEFDRIIMPAPYGHDHFLEKASELVRSGGIINFYTFKKNYEVAGFRNQLEKSGFKIAFSRRCGNVAPGVSRYAFDLIVN